MLYRAIHKTHYAYEGLVSYSHSEIRLTPRILPYQKLLDWSLDVEPRTAALLSRKDYFGNDVVTFAVYEPHQEFSVTSSSLLEVQSIAFDVEKSEPWESVADHLAVADGPDALAALEFRWDSPYVPWVDAIYDYGAESFQPGWPVYVVAEHLMRRIYRDFAYKPKATTIDTPLAEVFAGKAGVCQDFAHVMIGALRARGLAARYVSGYLRGDADLEGAQASHAWVGVYSPSQGWLDFDPTNNQVPGSGHLTLAFGRDYGDVTPVKGISTGGGQHKLEVEVSVHPVDESALNILRN
jgi:transglutaminase-like putative cysteine protease